MSWLNFILVLGMGIFCFAVLVDIKNLKENPKDFYFATRLFTNFSFLIGFLFKFIGFSLKYKFNIFIYPILTLLLLLCCTFIVIYLEKIRNSSEILKIKKYILITISCSIIWFFIFFMFDNLS